MQPLDEWEADLYAMSDPTPSIDLWSFLAFSLVFFGLAAVVLLLSVIGRGSMPQEMRLGLGSLLLFTGSALLAGWILGLTITIGARLTDRIK